MLFFFPPLSHPLSLLPLHKDVSRLDTGNTPALARAKGQGRRDCSRMHGTIKGGDTQNGRNE